MHCSFKPAPTSTGFANGELGEYVVLFDLASHLSLTRHCHDVLTPHQDLCIASKYRLQRRIGGGSFGAVYIGNRYG